MKKFFLAIAALLMLIGTVSAGIRRVGFFGAPISGVDFSTFAAAYTAAASGDTILVFPGIVNISQTISKKVIVIGNGDWLDPTSTPKGNANMQAFPGVATVSQFIINAGSDGSVFMGLEGGSYYVDCSNITIRRNRELLVYIAEHAPGNSTNNIQLLENYRLNVSNYFTNGCTVTGLNISNNFMTGFSTVSGNTYNGNISNNVWALDGTQTSAVNGGSSTLTVNASIELGGGAYLFQNNIIACYYSSTLATNFNYLSFGTPGNTVFNYNMALQTGSGPAQTWGTGVGNVITPIANAPTIFAAFPVLGSSSADARYQLNASSPALTVGAGGTPIGMFTGTSPYKLSMIPPIPSIYQLSSPQGNNPPGSTIQINLSTRGNN